MKNKARVNKIKYISMIIIVLIIILSSFLTTTTISNAYTITYTQQVKSGIDAFPESYKPYLKELQEQHPSWTFDAYYTGIPWNDLVQYETDHGHNRVIKTADALWRCSCGDVASGYACASADIIKYYMDPRNFLDSDKKIFQFLESSYHDNYKVEVVQSILKNTFMNGEITFKKDGVDTKMSYAQIIMEAAKISQVSPYTIAIKIIQEVGTQGSGSVTGTYEFTYTDGKKYKGYYNFFNYGAYDTGSAVTNGLMYAKDRGWDTPYKAIIEGAQKYSADYNAKGQNTIYFTKWDVVGKKILKAGETQTVTASSVSGNELFRHQYMTNVQDPTNQSSRLYNTYSNNDLIDEKLNFVIPIYENMPTANKLPSALTSKDGDLYYTTGTAIMVRSEPSTKGAKVDCIQERDTIVTVLERKTATNDGLEWDKVKLADGKIGYIASKYLEPCAVYNSKKAEITSDNKIKAIPNATVKDIVSELAITKYEVTKDTTKVADTDVVGTGYKLKDTANNKEYIIIVPGDVNGDAKVLANDALTVLKCSTGATSLKDIYLEAADTNKDQKVLATDALKILKCSTGAENIVL